MTQSLPPDGGEPVRSLLDEIRLLHRRVGEPSSREVVRRIGRGVISHTTVNAVLRGSRVPRWDPLRQVVVALGGDLEQFRALWMKARDAEDRTGVAAEPAPAVSTPLVGRVPETELMRGRVAGLAGGRGGAVLIEGDPGIGKSFLMKAVAAYAETQGCRTLWASCDELSQAFPLLPLLDSVDASVPAEERAGPPTAAAFQFDPMSGDRPDLVGAATEWLMALVEELCAATPVVLMVDDIQWADGTTMAALGRLVRMTRRLPLLVVMAARRIPQRRDLGVLRRALLPTSRIRLTGLSSAEVTRFLATSGGGPPGPRLVELAKGAGGNPLYLTELMAALDRAGALREVDGRVELTTGKVPGSLAAAIADRLDFLSDAARDILRTAALLGAEFAVTELMTVLRRDINELIPALDEAIDAGVLRGEGTQLAFRHPLLRTALYEETAPAVRAAWHLGAAKALAEAGAAAERVARQLLPAVEGGGADSWTAKWLVGSAHELVGRAPHAAIPLLRWVVEGTATTGRDRDVLCCRLADALRRAGDTEGAARVAGEAVARVTDPALLVDLLWTLAETEVFNERADNAFAALDAALALPDTGLRDRARIMVIAARTRCMVGEVERGEELASEALAAAIEAGDQPTTVRALSVLSVARAMGGNEVDGLRLCERALAAAGGAPALADLRLSLEVNRAAMLSNLDRLVEAREAAERVRASADQAGNVLRLRQIRSFLVETLFDTGRWDDALFEAESMLEEPIDAENESFVMGMVSIMRAHRDLAFDGSDLFDRERFGAPFDGRLIGSVLLAIGLAHERAGRPAEALAVLVRGLSGSEETVVVAELLPNAARLAVALEDQAAASVVSHHIADVTVRSRSSPFNNYALHASGLLARDPFKLEEAARRYEAAGRPLPRAQALEAAAVALAEAGDADAARVRLDEARRLYAGLGAEWDLVRTTARLVSS